MMAAPWAAVPLPGGRPLPSGPMLMSQRARSDSLIFWPRPGGSAASAVPAVNAIASGMRTRLLRTEITLHIDMFRLPVALDGPAHDVVHVPHREGDDRRVDLRRAALGPHLLARRLDIAGLIPGPALQHDGLAIPAPGHAKARECLRHHGSIKRRLRP